MPFGLRRYQQAQQSHFITFSCYHRQQHLGAPDIRTLFVRKLEQTRVRYRLRVYGFVVMPEHVHLLLSEPEQSILASAIQSLKLAVSLETCQLRRSRLWQTRYFDANVDTNKQFIENLRYIHRNPVKRGLVAKPEEWQWSSFRHYAAGDDVGVEIESERTARARQ